MINNAMFVGRLVSDPIVQDTGKGNVSNITIAVPRSYKNEEGIYETDFIDCTLWKSIAENTAEYCKKGDIIGIRGRVETDMVERDGEKKKITSVIAEKVSFLSSSRNRSQEQNISKEDDFDEIGR